MQNTECRVAPSSEAGPHPAQLVGACALPDSHVARGVAREPFLATEGVLFRIASLASGNMAHDAAASRP